MSSSCSADSTHEIELLRCGAEFFPALLSAIDHASCEVLLETYIFASDEAAHHVLQSLIRAAERGVSVYLITDWVGTGSERSRQLQKLYKNTAVQHRVFNRWFLRGATRTHRKLCVVDRSIAFVGGINIMHDLASTQEHACLESPRWDLSVRIQGSIVAAIHQEAQAQWRRIGHMHPLERLWMFARRMRGTPLTSSAPQRHGDAVFLASDHLHHRMAIQREYLRAMGQAQRSLLLVTPYFAPGRTFRDALSDAAKRGVEVTLLLGVGQFILQDWVARSYYRKLLGSGVQLIEYRKTQLHAKVAVIDGIWSTVGSSNCDGLSLFVNHEANVVFHDAAFAHTLEQEIRLAIADGTTVGAQEFAGLTWYRRLLYGAAFLVYRGLMRVVTLNAFG